MHFIRKEDAVSNPVRYPECKILYIYISKSSTSQIHVRIRYFQTFSLSFCL